jgi:hypothetical protein
MPKEIRVRMTGIQFGPGPWKLEVSVRAAVGGSYFLDNGRDFHLLQAITGATSQVRSNIEFAAADAVSWERFMRVHGGDNEN